ncbi:MAG: RHS repeat protein [Acidobacteria bacterium ACB2]|nr:RHS repeat protein [Acidobacteria bacterium ACB2]
MLQPFPIRVSPGAVTANLPKTSVGDVPRLVLLLVSGTTLPGDSPQPEPTSTGTRYWNRAVPPATVWKTEPDPVLDTGSAAFRLSLVDGNGAPVADGDFRVHLCPRFPHETAGAGCSMPPVASSDGVIPALSVNTDGTSADQRGYLGVELTRAPETGGYVFLKLESIGQTHRLQNSSDFVTRWNGTAGEYEGAFAFFFVDEHAKPCSKCAQCAGEPCKGSPNFVGTGTYTSAATDLVVPGTGKPIVVSRNYYGTPGLEGAHGKGWRSSAETGLGWVYSHSFGKTLDVTMPDGFVHKFTVDPATGELKPPAGRKDELVRQPDATWEMTLEKSRERYLFSKEGKLAAQVDEFGNRIRWEYDGAGRLSQIVDDGTGRGVVFSWSTGGRIGSVHDHAGRQVVYGYDPDGTLRTVTDVLTRTWQYGWTEGRFGSLLSRVTDPWGRVVTDVTYDEVDRTKTYTQGGESYTYEYLSAAEARKTSGSGKTWIYTLDADGLITQRSEPGESTTTTYDDDGQVLSRRDGAGVVTQYGYTPEGHVSSVTHDPGGTTAVRYDYTYDSAFPEKVATVTPVDPATGLRDTKRQAWRYEYVPAGSPGAGGLQRVLKVPPVGPEKEVASYEYDLVGRLTAQTSPGGARVDYDYGASGDLELVTGAANDSSGRRPVTGYGHDLVGRVTSVTDPEGRVTSYTYDALGRVLTVTLPSVSGRSFVTTYSYDHYDGGSGLLYTHVTDPNDRVTKLGYDVHGRLVRSEDAAGKATSYAYAADKLASITDANGNLTGYQYDTAGRLEKTVFPDLAEESYTYTPDGLLRRKTDRRGVTITYTYDALKRLTEKLYPGGRKVTYVYEGERLARVEDGTTTPAETHVFGYDEEGRVTSVSQGNRGTVTYTYDAEDRVETQGIGGGPTATYGYNPDGSLRTIGWSPVPGSFAWTYTASGQYQTVAFPNGQARTYGYDAQGRLTQIESVLGPATIARYGYGYDVDPQTGQPTQLGQRTSQTTTLPHAGITEAVTTYGYDPLYQLTGAQYPAGAPFNGEQHAWTYDDIGNRLTATVNAQAKTYTYEKNGANPKNGQRLTSDGEAGYTYDANGNTQTRTQGALAYGFGYDNENRLVEITGSEPATYTYDYQGRRTSKTVAGTTTTYLYDGLNLVAETTGGQTSYFLNGPGIDEPIAMTRAGTTSYFSVDGLGSVVATSDSSGTVTHSVVFDAWGNVKAETGTRTHPFTYTGREVGEAGLHFYRARYYQPSVGRFTQEDPIPLRGGAASYSYVGGDPLGWVDPLGLRRVIIGTIPGPNGQPVPIYADSDTRSSASIGGPTDNSPSGTTELMMGEYGKAWAAMVAGEAAGAAAVAALTHCARWARLAGLGDEIIEWLGPGFRMIKNKHGDRVFVSADKSRVFRVDINHTAPHANPHAHFEYKDPTGKWVRSPQVYPRDVPKN